MINIPDHEIGNGVYSMSAEGLSLYKPVSNSDEEFYCYNASKLLIEGKYAEAEEEYKFAITLGYRKAVMHYATTLDMGWIGKQDSELAMMLYRDLAYQSDSPDYKTAFELFSKAAKLGDETAMYQIGRFYKEGYYVGRDYEKAVLWFGSRKQ